jgi:hypothetical protein
MSATRLDVRGFYQKSPAARELLESIGHAFLTGYAFAAESRMPADAEEQLEGISTSLRGFAYEGAAMCFAVRDGLPGGRHDHVARFLSGRGDAHVYMVYVGVGWAMARLPRWRWSGLYARDPLLRWLVLDGYGFHQAYFHTRRYVHEQYREAGFPWPVGGPRWYAGRVIDQGIGRACWFVGGADAERVAALLDRFPEARRPDLYSGAGLAATYAGGANSGELEWLWQHAGDYRPQLAQGSAFAAGARVRAGLVMPHNEVATRVLCGTTVAEASTVTDVTRPVEPATGQTPSYEFWRRAIADRLVAVRG